MIGVVPVLRAPRRRLVGLALVLLAATASIAGAATNNIFTVAGTGSPGFSGDGGPLARSSAQLSERRRGDR